ncbi:phosphosulfolactate synthase [Calderihabitans maritimus]|uniref:Phosphosulfolactate synthase n=1 Tax=Calderihabitans maritimus TaxID=1246530 RepID=A0A1Z5HVY9_9FIRM|nr:phosphosulfolactate synthase [Calderihabitans maritimus]GAW93694.1 Phosphosulfolactate synthase [Calderihabitans maritimus]
MKQFQNFKAWKEILDFPLKGRQAKPRDKGLSMIIDKGMGITETRELLELAADYIDFIKLGFGTSAFYSPKLLREKTELVRSCGVDIFPGGTFLEVAVLQGKLERFLGIAGELGFNCIEVSDGTIDMPVQDRARAIKLACRAGFKVLSEVGKKDPRDSKSSSIIKDQIARDLDCGAFKVIVEGRESGQGVVIYDAQGEIKEKAITDLVEAVEDVNVLLWEAPLKKQQQELIMRFGPNVNLGNIQPGEVLALEALRVGLRGDTLRMCIELPSSLAKKERGVLYPGQEIATVEGI